ncbi:hypothetical protein RIF29_25256 [Crotalaria pallida]|uniref:Uncharacterized protein n=1 Tax=Crotalaria pallida TaxID=3830 RepID=A0AAN9HZM3_CROPI
MSMEINWEEQEKRNTLVMTYDDFSHIFSPCAFGNVLITGLVNRNIRTLNLHFDFDGFTSSRASMLHVSKVRK